MSSPDREKSRVSEPTKGRDPADTSAIDQAFTEFYIREQRRVVAGIAMYLRGDWATAQDIAQEAFVLAFERWAEISEYQMPGSWVLRVAYRRATREKLGNWQRRVRTVADSEGLNSAIIASFDPEPIEMTRMTIMAVLGELPAKQQSVVALYFDGYSAAEISSIIGKPAVTVRSHLSQGRRKLRKLFSDLETRLLTE